MHREISPFIEWKILDLFSKLQIDLNFNTFQLKFHYAQSLNLKIYLPYTIIEDIQNHFIFEACLMLSTDFFFLFFPVAVKWIEGTGGIQVARTEH